jgi:CheY-like chemotaxis protein
MKEESMARILIIDDNEDECTIVQTELNAAGYQTIIANNGDQGVALAKQFLPDLILCDINMPGMNGFETYRVLKSFSQTKALPFVFLTGSADAMSGKFGTDLGGEEFIEKPFSFSKLLAVVQSRLDK